MKYIEQIKSIILFLLILLSLALTFTIWNFTPSFEELESATPVEVSIGESKSAEEVIKPIKVLYHSFDVVTGTTEQEKIDALVTLMGEWQIRDITQVEEGASPTVLSSYMHGPNRTVLYYPGTVPFPVFDVILQIDENTIPEASFDRVVIERGTDERSPLTAYFINSTSGGVYQGIVAAEELEEFQDLIVQALDYESYITDDAIGVLPIYVPENGTEEVAYSYLMEEIASRSFRNGLFDDPANVQSTGDILDEEYTDDSAVMRLDDEDKMLTYIQPRAETTDPAIPSDLLFDTVNFVNEHGGWTNDYRYFGVNALNQQIDYRLFVSNKPVFSDTTATKMELTWGADAGVEQIFSYRRPYYLLESAVETNTVELASGEVILSGISRLENLDPSSVTDIIQAYELTRNDADQLIQIQPMWYVKVSGTWQPLTSETLGGSQLGLE
ncbi:YycH family regulatory protein [Planococcus salinus]|uniref:Transcriptional regulator n=1 Tax=Planococcus salinus TaxID=1848460 RepID=A0A3M8P9Q0_9BACL|nr:two-component system activity regulator YycH [Planococcus salinus]RNF39914.1 transcriptional regulator [Planococcus salinus]